MPFTGIEFGGKIINEYKLNNIVIEPTDKPDHYDPDKKKVCILKHRLDKRSITSLAIICHEIGHALQDKEDYKPLMWRQKMIKKTQLFQKIGSVLIFVGAPTIYTLTKSPFLTLICALITLGCLSTNVLIHLVTLPVELDASFKRALPILKKYVPKENLKQCKSVLRAAAFTYLGQSILGIFRLRIVLLSFISIFRIFIRR